MKINYNMVLTLNKIAAGVVGFAMVAGLALAFTATKAHAVTLTELVELFIALEVIPADKAEEARSVLEGQEEGDTEEATTPSLATAMSCSFTRDLKTGATGQDVMDLQKLLNAKGYTVSTTGAGSAGMETEYYGPATAAAVSKLQMAYAAEILTPLGLTAGTGFFGASTRAKANALCANETPATDDDEDTDEDTDEDEDTDLSGEASINVFEINSADDDTIEEGDEEAAIAELNVEFSDGDAMITRLDVSLVADDTNEETDPWDTFDTISLMVDDEVVAEMDASDEDEYLNENDGTLRFAGLDIVAMEDEEIVITVAATVANSVDGTADGAVWEVSVDSMRFVDGDDVTSTEDTGDDFGTPVDFTIEEAGAEDEIIVKSSSSDLKSSILKAEDNSKSDWVTIFVFDLDTDDSVSDITVNEIPVTINTPATSTYAGLVDDARLVIDGTTVDSTSADVDVSSTTSAVVTFDVDGDVVIEAGERVKAELQVRLKALAVGDEGATIYGAVTEDNVADIDAEGADDLTGDALDGSAEGDVHQIYTTGVFAEPVSVDTDAEGTDGNIGVFTIKFEVTAFEGDFYIFADADNTATTGALYSLDGVTTATDSGTLSSTAEEVATDIFEIKDGETEVFTLKINATVGTAGDVRAQLEKLFYADSIADADDGGAVLEHVASPSDEFRTDFQLINV